ncbi:unnamed protein product [Acanthocheilonema viteae]|uniref:Uncharacterized protein n=1 Tax=Acanthocheilonema viteae TaxID=6277 RepID=A0A498SE80_ACAVI|nr:unnamed protein product [Acanthocheilonema viteae]
MAGWFSFSIRGFLKFVSKLIMVLVMSTKLSLIIMSGIKLNPPSKPFDLSDSKIRAWAESKKNLPGKFTGSTGVNVLKADQLGPDDPRFSVWAKKKSFGSIRQS